MRNFFLVCFSALIATSAVAQTTPAVREPMVMPPDYPKAAAAPGVAAPVTPAATNAPVISTNDLAKAVNKLAGNKNSQQQMGQMLVIGSILGCTQKTAGQAPTKAFYEEMQGVGKTAETYCKQGNATEARALLLSTFAAKKDDVVVKSALSCYDDQKQAVASLGGAQVATDAEHYARWLRDPEIAKTEMKESDICRKSKKS